MKEIVLKKKIAIAGAGGFGRETYCCLADQLAAQQINASEWACFMVPDHELSERTIMGIPVITDSEFDPAVYDAVVALGDPVMRRKVVSKMPQTTHYASIIHPSAVISEWVEIGEGAIITAGTIITCNVKIGKHAQLNLHSTIGHDCVAGDFFTTAPGANISGMCTFGDAVYIGTNAAVKQGISICSNVTVGMGGAVLKNIDTPGVYIGSPAKIMIK